MSSHFVLITLAVSFISGSFGWTLFLHCLAELKIDSYKDLHLLGFWPDL